MLYTIFIKPIIKLLDWIFEIRFGVPSPALVLDKVTNPLIPRKIQRVGMHYVLLSQKYPEVDPKTIVKMMSYINGNSERFNLSILKSIVRHDIN
jgi:hypothetical protein